METLTSPPPTSIENAHFDAKRRFFDSGHTRTYSYRIAQLKALLKGIERHEDAISKAVFQDLHKSEAEAYITEIAVTKEEIKHTLNHLREWMQAEKRNTPLVLQPSSSRIIYEPKGVVLIIAPWNYPFQLAIAPLIGAIAAGNCAVVKPSEEAPATAVVIETLINDMFSNDYISVVQGLGHEVVPAMMKAHDFNHIFFTGSPAVGSIVAKQAADKLTPTTLELGGKSPGIVDASADLKTAARRLVFAKFTNAGQTCVAPDYLLLHSSIKDKFLAEAKKCIVDFYGKDPQKSKDYGRMVNSKRFNAVSALIGDGTVIYGGQTDAADKYIAPTLIEGADLDSPVMQEEIFGPVWPVHVWNERKDLLEITRRMRYPLACYVFTTDKATEKLVTEQVEFGGGCVNNALLHLANPDLPFGGVQESGSGNYHGWHSFAAFSHTKSILKSATWIDPRMKYPPFGKWKLGWLKRLMG
ncbi:MAG: aldehyde dehydrogenase [Cryomorphaceae bacterium]